MRVFEVMCALVANRCATCQDDEEAGAGLGMGWIEVEFEQYKLNQIDNSRECWEVPSGDKHSFSRPDGQLRV